MNAIKDVMFNVSLQNFRGQTCDGARNMMRNKPGVAIKLLVEQLKALVTHCQDHSKIFREKLRILWGKFFFSLSNHQSVEIFEEKCIKILRKLWSWYWQVVSISLDGTGFLVSKYHWQLLFATEIMGWMPNRNFWRWN